MLAREALETGGDMPTRIQVAERAPSVREARHGGIAQKILRSGRILGAAGMAATPIEFMFFEDKSLPHTLQNMAYLQGPLTLRHIPDEVENVLRANPMLTQQLWVQGVINDDVYGEVTPPTERVRLLPESE